MDIEGLEHPDKWAVETFGTAELGDVRRTIARFGGYLDRRSDPPPGWQTLWKGWIYVQTILQGVSLARQFSPS